MFKTTLRPSIAVGFKIISKNERTYASTVNWTIWSNEACCSELKSCTSNSSGRRYPLAVVNHLACRVSLSRFRNGKFKTFRSFTHSLSLLLYIPTTKQFALLFVNFLFPGNFFYINKGFNGTDIYHSDIKNVLLQI